MQKIPLRAIPSQELHVVLSGQDCTMFLYWRWGRLYLDLTVGAVPVCRGAVCQCGASVVQFPMVNFAGSLHFWDVLGKQTTPRYDELGSRFILLYVPAGEALPEALSF